jgi:predicted RND superfamily exporter protein
MIQPAKLVVSFPKTIIATTAAITIAYIAVILIYGVTFNGSPETLARKDDTFRFYNETRSIFGDDRAIVVALTTSDVFTPSFLERLDRLTSKLAAISGVDQAMSLTNVKAIRRDEAGVSVGRLIDAPAIGQANAVQLNTLKQEVIHDPLYARHYVSLDGNTAAIDVLLKSLNESQTRAVAEQIEQLAKSEANGDEVFVSGVPIVDARGIKSMLRDMLLLSPISAVLCFAVFFFAFRSLWGALLPMAALIVGLIWTIGLMSLLGRPITLATLPLPTTLMAVGGSYIFHVLNQYRVSMLSLSPNADLKSEHDAWLKGLSFIGPAVIVSGTATMAGFGALASSAVPTARDMGIFEALGVLALLVLTVIFLPATLHLLPRDALGKTGAQADYAKSLHPLLVNVTALVLFRRRTILLATLFLTIVIGAGAKWLEVNTNYLQIFPRHSETVRDAEKLHERLAGAATVQLVVTGSRGSTTHADFLQAAAALEQFALQQPGVDSALSVVDIVKRINSVLKTAGTGIEEIPADDRSLSTIFTDYLSQDESLSRLISADGSRLVIILRANLFSSTQLQKLTRTIDEWSALHLPSGITQRATGSIILLNDASDAVAASQSSSLAIALVTIYLMMVLLFRSFATGFLALLPNLIPIVWYFGFLGWSDTPLDITTSLVASAVLGLAVDNAVHMIRRYRQCVSERAHKSIEPHSEGVPNAATDEGWAMWMTMVRTGKPMVLANVMLIAAFLVFVLSSFVPVRIAGLLWAFTISTCLGGDLIFLPVLFKTRMFARAALGKHTHDSIGRK